MNKETRRQEVRTLKKPVSVKFELKVVKENGKERQAFSDKTYRYEDGTEKVVPMADEDRKYFEKAGGATSGK